MVGVIVCRRPHIVSALVFRSTGAEGCTEGVNADICIRITVCNTIYREQILRVKIKRLLLLHLLLLLFCLCKNEGRKAFGDKADLIVYSYVLKLLYLAVIGEVAKRRMLGIFHLIALQSDLSAGLFVEDLSFDHADLKGVVKFLLSQLFLQLENCVGIIPVLGIQLPHFQFSEIGKSAVCQGIQNFLRLSQCFVGVFLNRRFFGGIFLGDTILHRRFL